MPDATPLLNSLNGGELSPKLDSRSDIAKYFSGCRTLQNMVPFVEGGAMRIPGTYFAKEVKTSSKATRVIPFHFSTTQAYAIEFGDLYIRFYMDNGIIMDGINVYEIASPYLEADLFQLKFIQSADVMYIFHPSYATKQLTRTAHTSWTLTDFVAKTQDAFTITAATKANPCVVTVTYTDTAWVTATGYVVGDIRVSGNYHYYCLEAHTSGTFATDLSNGLWRRLDLPVAGDIMYISGVVGMTEINSLYFTAGTVTDGAGTATIQLSGINSTNYTAYTSGGTLQKAVVGTANHRPSCGCFYGQRMLIAGMNDHVKTVFGSAVGDYSDFTLDASDDSAGIQYTMTSDKVDRIRWMIGEDRVIIGTTGGVWKFDIPTTPTTDPPEAKKHIYVGVDNIQPQVVGDFIFFVTRSGLSIRRIVYDFGMDKYKSQDMTRLARHILLGTSMATSGIKDMSYQQEPVPILWVTRKDGVLLGLVCDIEENVFPWFRVVTDGLFESVAVISKDNEEDQVWVVANRTISAAVVRYMEYFKPQEFFSDIKAGFFVHSGLSFDGGPAVNIAGISKAATAVVTVTAWPHWHDGTTDTDLVDGDKVMVEGVVGMTEVNQTYPLSTPYTVAGANKGALTFQLSGVNSTNYTAWASGGTVKIVKAAFTTLDHLVGKSVVAIADGYACPAETVAAGGNATFDYFGNQVHAGLAYIPIIVPMKVEAGSQLGASRGKKQRISKITAVLYETGEGVEIGPDVDNLMEVTELVDGTLNTLDYEFSIKSDWKRESTLYIRQTKPLPMTILALVPRVNVNED